MTTTGSNPAHCKATNARDAPYQYILGSCLHKHQNHNATTVLSIAQWLLIDMSILNLYPDFAATFCWAGCVGMYIRVWFLVHPFLEVNLYCEQYPGIKSIFIVQSIEVSLSRWSFIS